MIHGKKGEEANRVVGGQHVSVCINAARHVLPRISVSLFMHTILCDSAAFNDGAAALSRTDGGRDAKLEHTGARRRHRRCCLFRGRHWHAVRPNIARRAAQTSSARMRLDRWRHACRWRYLIIAIYLRCANASSLCSWRDGWFRTVRCALISILWTGGDRATFLLHSAILSDREELISCFFFSNTIPLDEGSETVRKKEAHSWSLFILITFSIIMAASACAHSARRCCTRMRELSGDRRDVGKDWRVKRRRRRQTNMAEREGSMRARRLKAGTMKRQGGNHVERRHGEQACGGRQTWRRQASAQGEGGGRRRRKEGGINPTYNPRQHSPRFLTI